MITLIFKFLFGLIIQLNFKEFYEKKVLLIALFLVISLLVILPFTLENKIYVNDDFLFHKTRLLAYYHSIRVNHDFHPMIFNEMAKGYGYAADLFYPSYVLLPFVFFYSLGIGFIKSYYLLLFTYTFLTLIIGFYSAQHYFKNNRTALVATIAYTFGTYRLIDLFIRGDLGEVGAYIFLPLVILGFYMIYQNEKYGILTLAIGLGLVTGIHPMTTLICVYITVIINLYLVVKKQNTIAFIKKQLYAYVLAIILASATVFPILEQMAYGKYNFMNHNPLWGVGLNFSLSKLIYGSMENSAGVWNNTIPNVGPILLLSVIISLFKYKSSSMLVKKLLVITIIFLVSSTNLLFWPILKNTWISNIQFEWRILIFATLFGSLLLAKISETTNQKNVKLIIFLILSLAVSFNYSILNNFQANNNLTLNNKTVLTKYNSAIGGGLDYLSKGINYSSLNKEKSTGSFNFNRETVVMFPKIYYKGYVIQTNDNQEIKTFASHGFVAAKIMPGEMTYQVIYKKTMIQKWAIRVTLYSWLIVIIYVTLAYIIWNKKNDT